MMEGGKLEDEYTNQPLVTPHVTAVPYQLPLVGDLLALTKGFDFPLLCFLTGRQGEKLMETAASTKEMTMMKPADVNLFD